MGGYILLHKRSTVGKSIFWLSFANNAGAARINPNILGQTEMLLVLFTSNMALVDPNDQS